MKIKNAALLLLSTILLASAGSVFAQGMMGNAQNGETGYTMMGENTAAEQNTGDQNTQTATEQNQQQALINQLQNNQINCQNLTDDDFDVIGDYFMGEMMGINHEAMDNIMTQMMGTDGEKQMHIVMGKRYSGCDTAAALPQQYQQYASFMPMMGNYAYQNQYLPMGNMMWNANYQNSPWNSMMGFQSANPGFPLIGWISILLGWTVLIMAIVALGKYIQKK